MPETLHDSDLDDAFRNTRFVPDPAFRKNLRARLHAHQRARTSSSPPSAFASNGWRRLLFTRTDPPHPDEEDDPMNNTSRLIPAFAGVVVIALVAALALGVLPGVSLFGAPQPVLIDDFESGTLDGWTLDCEGGCWFPYSDGSTPPDPERTDPEFPFEMPEPPQGSFAAVTDMNDIGRRIMYRDVELDGQYILHMTVFYTNNYPMFVASDVLTVSLSAENQQYRIDLMRPSAPVDSLEDGDVLASIFATALGDPATLEPTEVTVDLSEWAGQTVRLRLASADTMGPLRAGVDNIYLERVR